MTTLEFPLPRSSSALRYPEWQLEYQDVLLETEPKKLAKRVADAEVAIFRRLQELSESHEGQAERWAIREAAHGLWAVKRDRLGFPDWELEKLYAAASKSCA
jgi:hypothetical protein